MYLDALCIGTLPYQFTPRIMMSGHSQLQYRLVMGIASTTKPMTYKEWIVSKSGSTPLSCSSHTMARDTKEMLNQCVESTRLFGVSKWVNLVLHSFLAMFQQYHRRGNRLHTLQPYRESNPGLWLPHHCSLE